MRINKRAKVLASSSIGLVAIAGALFFGYTNLSHAASASTDPHFLTSDTYLANGHEQFKAVTPNGHKNGQGHTTTGLAGVDSVPSWNSHYFQAGYNGAGDAQNEWFTNTVGTLPNQPGTTTIDAPIIPVTIQLVGKDGSIVASSDPTKYVQPVVNSPIFQNSTYSSSGTPTQYTDAVQRAEFYNEANPSWHTMLKPVVEQGLTMTIPYGEWYASTNKTTGALRYALVDYDTFSNLLFPATATDTTTVIGKAEHAGMITTKDIATFLFPDTYLYFGDPNNCCVLGFHGPDIEPGDASNGNKLRAYDIAYASWITPGLFGGDTPDDAPQDVTALSHELSETFNDPFVTMDGIHDVTPWWASSFNCQNNLEDGDVIAGLPRDNTVIPMNGFNYHVQNEALMSWFEGQQAHSSSINGAYSYPDTTTLTSPAVSMQPGCTGPAQ